MTTLAAARLAGSVRELLAGATAREQLGGTDGKSGALLERVVIDGERYVVKYLGVDRDWVARASGDLGCRPLLLWRSGLFRLPSRLPRSRCGGLRA